MLAKRPLGSTGLTPSILGLGTVKLGRDQGVKYPEKFTIPDDREAANLLACAWDLGINLLDTAPSYGNSEQRLGQLLAGQRQQWLICTKVGEEFENGQSAYDFSPEHTRFSIERSLRRLGTDYLDMVLVHSDGNDEDIIVNQGTLQALAELKKAGKLRAFGMSTKTVAGGLLAARHADCVMITWNLQYQDEVPVIDYCHQQQKGVLIKKALASGHLAVDGLEANQKCDPVARNFELIFSHPGVSSAIIGTINPNHLRSNVNAARNISAALKVTTNTP